MNVLLDANVLYSITLTDVLLTLALMRNHPADRHVLAAAAAYRADLIVTSNLRHFRAAALIDLPIGDVVTPDALLCDLHDANPAQVMTALDRLMGRKQRPPMTIATLAERLSSCGASAFAARLVPAATLRRGG